MPYAHKLDMYLDPPHKKVVFCKVCGQDSDLAGSCPGEVKLTAKDDENFMRIFGDAYSSRKSLKASKQLEKIIKG